MYNSHPECISKKNRQALDAYPRRVYITHGYTPTGYNRSKQKGVVYGRFKREKQKQQSRKLLCLQ